MILYYALPLGQQSVVLPILVCARSRRELLDGLGGDGHRRRRFEDEFTGLLASTESIYLGSAMRHILQGLLQPCLQFLSFLLFARVCSKDLQSPTIILLHIRLQIPVSVGVLCVLDHPFFLLLRRAGGRHGVAKAFGVDRIPQSTAAHDGVMSTGSWFGSGQLGLPISKLFTEVGDQGLTLHLSGGVQRPRVDRRKRLSRVERRGSSEAV